MLNLHNASAVLSVHDLAAARIFYEQTLGLTAVDTQEEELVTYRTGNTLINVYRSQFAGTNKATAVVWSVGNELDDIVKQLKAKGVQFEHYDMPGQTLEGDVHVFGDMRVVWFKDPAGNLLNLINE
jgi:catechol 2,3-dioxygenase-like lactoylglutathione lyase family enzyme